MISGLIAIWSGEIADIPSGWHLCDGTDGTPDLRDRFVRGAGGIYNPGVTGGLPTHTHGFTGDNHTHDLLEGSYLKAGDGYSNVVDAAPAVGTTDPSDNIPPYYALAFIMKL